MQRNKFTIAVFPLECSGKVSIYAVARAFRGRVQAFLTNNSSELRILINSANVIVVHNYCRFKYLLYRNGIDISHEGKILDLYALSAFSMIGSLSQDKIELGLLEILQRNANEIVGGIFPLVIEHLILDPTLIKTAEDKKLVTEIPKAMLKAAVKLNSIAGFYYHTYAEPALKVSGEMTVKGIHCDVEKINSLLPVLKESIQELKDVLRKNYGVINIYADNKLGNQSKGSQKLFNDTLHEVKSKSSVVNAFMRYSDQIDGGFRIHPEYVFHSNTSRIANVNPCIGNLNRDFRYLITAGDDSKCLLYHDMSNLEIRVLASLSGDLALRSRCNDVDVYMDVVHRSGISQTSTGTEFYRKLAKKIFIAACYGQQKDSLLAEIEYNMIEIAEKIYDYIHTQYNQLFEYLNKLVIDSRLRGYVESIGGFRRLVNTMPTGREETTIRNNYIQSCAADGFLKSLVAVDKMLKREYPDTAIIFQLHDALLTETPVLTAKNVDVRVCEIMRATFEEMFTGVSFPVNSHQGFHWTE